MTHPIPATAAAQFRGLFLSLVLDPELLFGRVLSTDAIAQAIAEEAGPTGDRVFTPVVTLATFLAQVLSDDHSCRAAVARLKGWLAARGLPPCSLATGGYCKARQRLPESLLPRLVRETGDGLQGRAPDGWLFHGRRVVIVDGSGVSMPDTPENQRGVPPALRAEAGLRLPDRPDRRAPVAGHRGGAGPGDRPLHRQADRRERPAAGAARPAEAGRHPAGRQLLQLVPGGGGAAGDGRRRGDAAARRAAERLPPGHEAGPRGPPGAVAAGPQPPALDGPRGVRRAAPVDRDAGAAGAGRQAGVPDQGVRGGDQPAGRGGVPAAGAGGPLPPEVACGIGHTVHQADDADGRAAVQDAGRWSARRCSPTCWRTTWSGG